MGQRVSTAVGNITESATLAVDAKAKALRATGEHVIGFGAGEPDFPTPSHIVQAASEACLNPANHRYSPAGGLPEMKASIVAKTARDSGLEIDPSMIVVTNGGKHAVYNTMLTLLDPGDEVILPAPYWTTYPEPIRLAGAVPVVVSAGAEAGFRVSVDQLEAARTDKTKALVFVSPSNPTGAVYPREEIEAIGRWAVEHEIWVITDEIYEHLTYGAHESHSLPVVVPEAADRCVVLNGVAKTYAMTGWRVGWMIAPPDITKAATSLQSHCTSNVANVSQRAAIAALDGGLDDVAMMRAAFDRRRLNIHRLLNEIDGVECIEPQGAFYAFPSFEALLGSEIAGTVVSDTVDLAALILDKVKVAFVPGEAFDAPGYARLSFALSDDDLAEGVERISALLGSR
ncbi:MAG: pyridoxal phosphate-dependent aminotransferase [Acidobacteria bacterium]|nr:pyridoxal phosphate-dependent aminotransferase [Acidobacteriota bacterium]